MINHDYKDWRLPTMKERDITNSDHNVYSKPPTVRPATPKHKTKFSRRRGLRKRFLSLTEGLTQIFNNERRSNESSFSKSNGNLEAKYSSEPEERNSGYWSDLSSEYSPSQMRKNSSSSCPSPELNGNCTPKSAKRIKFFRFNKMPPSPPPRRYSLLGKESKQRKKYATSNKNEIYSANTINSCRDPPTPPTRVSYTQALSMKMLPVTNDHPEYVYGQTYSDVEKKSCVYNHPASGSNSVRGGSIISNASTNSSINSQQINASATGEIIEKTISVVIDKCDGSFGFTVRGGLSSSGKTQPFVVTQVRSGGPADKAATLIPGDRLVAVDGKDISKNTLSDVQKTLKDVEIRATFTICYDVSIVDTVRTPGNILLVEIERDPGKSLGITLVELKLTNFYMNSQYSRSPLAIETMKAASIAERCGALAIGDVVKSVDGLNADNFNFQEINRILQFGDSYKIILEIMPCKSNSYKINKDGAGNRYSLYNTCVLRRQYSSTTGRMTRSPKEDTLYSGRCCTVNHTEVARITLRSEGMPLGVVLRPAPMIANPQFSFPTVAAVDCGGIADKSGVIFVGDKLLAVNGRNIGGLGVSEILQKISNSRPNVTVDIEFEVADAVVPSSGTFSVKLAKSNGGIGISIAKNRPYQQSESDEYVLICEVVRGSPAHRSGTLEVGDRILAVNNTIIDNYSLNDTRKLICGHTDIVTLRIKKDDIFSESGLVTYTVQLMKDGGSLGIFPSGGGAPFDPIYIRSIAPGSIADRTKAIHVGDRILAINGVSLRGKTLNETSILLHNPDDTLTMTITRQKVSNEVTPVTEWKGANVFQTAMSIDSAVDSWDSGGTAGFETLPNLSKLNEDTSQIHHKISNGYDSNDCSTEKETIIPSSSVSSSGSGQSEDKTDWDKMIADLNHISETCGLRQKELETYPNAITLQSKEINKNLSFASSDRNKIPRHENGKYFNHYEDIHEFLEKDGIYSVSQAAARHISAPFPADDVQIFSTTLQKDPVYEDFGFSVSDGLYEKGVYINRIRTGGPADRCVLLKPYDRILQVNSTNTDEFDCCLIVPLIASAGETLFLKLMRTGLHLPLTNFENKLIYRET